MKNILGLLALAAALVAAGVLALGESRRTREMAAARERLVTLHYDAGEALDAESAVPIPALSMNAAVRHHQATATYWRGRYDELVRQYGSVRLDREDTTVDPALAFAAANARFRESRPETGDRQAAVERLDAVIQAYADVLRLDPSHADAAYNYEYVSRLRDSVARARGARGKPQPVAQEPPGVDLPAGPTLHGRPGGPPPEVPAEEFRTLTPMSFEEREESDPGVGPAPRRKG